MKGEVLDSKTDFISPIFIQMPVPVQENWQLCSCAFRGMGGGGVNFASIIYVFAIGTALTVWYIFF